MIWAPLAARPAGRRRINNAGQIVGSADTSSAHRAFLYSGGVMTDLGTIGGAGSDALGISDNGQVTGSSDIAGGGTYHAFRYAGGIMTDLGTLGGTSSVGRSINNAGQVTGVSVHAFLSTGGGLTDLGTFGGATSGGSAINNAGQVAGGAALPNVFPQLGHAFLYSWGSKTDLGTLGTDSAAYGINELGQTVGLSYTGSRYHAFMTFEGALYDLNGLIPDLTASGFSYLDTANDINDNGWIVGTGVTAGGVTHAFLAQVVPEPASTVLLGLGTVLLAARQRQSRYRPHRSR